MSHHIKVRSKVTEKDYLIEALKKLGWVYSLNAHTGEITLGDQNALSLVQNKDGTWSVTGDPYYDNGKLRQYYNNTPQLLADIQSSYNQIMAKDKLSQLGYYLSQEEETAEEVTLVFDNWC